MMRIVGVLLFVLSWCLCGAEVLKDDRLHKSILPNGVQFWAYQDDQIPDFVSLRIVWVHDGARVEQGVEFLWQDASEVAGFFEDCKEVMLTHINEPYLRPLAEKIVVIAVGDFPENSMEETVLSCFGQLTLATQKNDALQIDIFENFSPVEVSFGYPMLSPQVESFADLKRRWTLFVLHDLLVKHLHSYLGKSPAREISTVEPWVLFPHPFASVKAKTDMDNALVVLAWSLVGVQELKQKGFSDDEFSTIKAKIYKSLLASHRRTVDCATLADYLVQHTVFETDCYEYNDYLKKSLQAIQQITYGEIETMMTSILKDENRFVRIRGPGDLCFNKEQVQEILDRFPADQFTINRIDLNDFDNQQIAIYKQLPITEEEEEIIWRLIDTLANNNPIALGLRKSEIEKWGDQIIGVHPLRFLGEIFSDSYLKLCMRDLRDSFFKWDSFVKGLANKMESETARNNLSLYTIGFCKTVGADPQKVRGFFQAKEWGKLLEYLISLK